MENIRKLTIAFITGTVFSAILFTTGYYFITYSIHTAITGTLFLVAALTGIFFYIQHHRESITSRLSTLTKLKASQVYSSTNKIFFSNSIEEKSKGLQELTNIVFSWGAFSLASMAIFSAIVSASIVVMGLLGTSIAIQQNKIIQRQNYLICQQNAYLESMNKFNIHEDNLFTRQETIGLFRELRSLIRVERRKIYPCIYGTIETIGITCNNKEDVNDYRLTRLRSSLEEIDVKNPPANEIKNLLSKQESLIAYLARPETLEKIGVNANTNLKNGLIKKYRDYDLALKELSDAAYARISREEKQIASERETYMRTAVNCDKYMD